MRDWSTKTRVPKKRFVGWIGISQSKFFDWKRRYGKINEHNGWIRRDHWLTDAECEAIIAYWTQNPEEGYRRLTYMMLDEDVVAVSASSVYRVLNHGKQLPSMDPEARAQLRAALEDYQTRTRLPDEAIYVLATLRDLDQ